MGLNPKIHLWMIARFLKLYTLTNWYNLFYSEVLLINLCDTDISMKWFSQEFLSV